MSKAIIACQTISDELDLAMSATGCSYPVIRVSSDYHMDPNLLRVKLQEEIDNLQGYDQILLAYGCCGNGLVGLRATTAGLIIPRTEDCISMVLSRPGEKFERLKYTYFLTRGWLQGSKSIAAEYEHACKRYGEARARKLFKFMLKNYNYLMVIDTGAYPLEDCLNRAEELAGHTGLKVVVSKGDVWLLQKLLTGPYDEDFCVIPRGGTVNSAHFGMAGAVPVHQVI